TETENGRVFHGSLGGELNKQRPVRIPTPFITDGADVSKIPHVTNPKDVCARLALDGTLVLIGERTPSPLAARAIKWSNSCRTDCQSVRCRQDGLAIRPTGIRATILAQRLRNALQPLVRRQRRAIISTSIFLSFGVVLAM